MITKNFDDTTDITTGIDGTTSTNGATNTTTAANTSGTANTVAASDAAPTTTPNTAPAPALTTTPTNGSLNAFKYFFSQIGKITLTSAAIFTLVMLVINIAFNYFAVSVKMDREWLAYTVILQNAIPYFMLVLGIVMPCYMELLLSYGITRRQQSIGLLGAAALISIITAEACTILLLFTGEFSLNQSAGQLLSIWFYFLVGWLVVLGYQYRRVFTAIASTLVGIILLGFWPLTNPWIFGSAAGLFMEINPTLLVTLGIAFCLFIPALIVVLARRISIKI